MTKQATQGGGMGTLAGMTYKLQAKGLVDGASVAEPPPPNLPAANQDPSAPEWAGDLYTEGDETAPEDTDWSFRGENGEEAWLDAATDGVLVGWVRAADGRVYRYSDVDAWAVDVDDAGMQRAGGGEAMDDGSDPAMEEGADDGMGEEVEPDGDEPEGDEPEPEVDPMADEPVEPVEPVEPEGDEPAEDPAAEDDEEDDDDTKPEFLKRKREGKSYRLEFRDRV